MPPLFVPLPLQPFIPQTHLLALYLSLTISFHSSHTHCPDSHYLSPELFFFTVFWTKSSPNTFCKFICKVTSDYAGLLTLVILSCSYDKISAPCPCPEGLLTHHSSLMSHPSSLQLILLPDDLTFSVLMTRCHYLLLCFCTCYSLPPRKQSLYSPVCSPVLCGQDL